MTHSQWADSSQFDHFVASEGRLIVAQEVKTSPRHAPKSKGSWLECPDSGKIAR